MKDYTYHPYPGDYGLELRDGWAVDDYIAQARGFRSTAEFREFRDSTSERQAEIIRAEKSRKSRDELTDDLPSDEDMRLYADYLRICTR